MQPSADSDAHNMTRSGLGTYPLHPNIGIGSQASLTDYGKVGPLPAILVWVGKEPVGSAHGTQMKTKQRNEQKTRELEGSVCLEAQGGVHWITEMTLMKIWGFHYSGARQEPGRVGTACVMEEDTSLYPAEQL